MFAQVISFDESPEEIEAGIKHVEEEVLPPLSGVAGLRAGYWLVDRERGKRISFMVWDSQEAADAGFAALDARRAELGDGPRPTPSSVERFEVYGSA